MPTAYDNGYNSFISGKDCSDNPFKNKTKKEEWEKGWWAAYRKSR